ncbi:MAG: hypothetical protein KC731_41010, partial [Myxococcales bacterium]|nr:hypothetical protein [Myxococcales bacterium]
MAWSTSRYLALGLTTLSACPAPTPEWQAALPMTPTPAPAPPPASGPRQLVAATGRACLVDATGGLTCWGRDARGIARLPERIDLGSGPLVQVALAPDQGCGLDEAGAVWCWAQTAQRVPLPRRARAIAVGEGRGCALLDDRSVHCWATGETARRLEGLAGEASLAIGARYLCLLDGGKPKCLPLDGGPLVAPRGSPPARALTLTGHDLCVLGEDDQVYAWGGLCRAGASGFGDYPCAPDELAQARDLVAGGGRTCAHRDGGWWCWGDDDLGLVTAGDEHAPRLWRPVPLAHDPDYQRLALGRDHLCGLDGEGRVECRGEGDALGRGMPTWATTRLRLPLPASAELALSAEQLCWRDGGAIECLSGRQDPEVLAESAELIGFRVDGARVCGWRQDGHLRCWHDDDRLARGIGGAVDLGSWGENLCVVQSRGAVSCVEGPDARGAFTAGPTAIAGLSAVTAIGVARDGACALSPPGSLRCWGLGVPLLELSSTARKMAVGAHEVCALEDAAVRCWALPPASAPPALTPVGGASALAVGAGHRCAVQDDALLCWGRGG